MTRFGVVLRPPDVRWAAAESVSETVIAVVLLLHERSVDDMVPRLTAAELEHIIKLVGRSPRLYAPRRLEASSLALPYGTATPSPQAAVAMDGTDKPWALTTKWRVVQVMGTRCSIDRRHR
jgi:hypothetical protein